LIKHQKFVWVIEGDKITHRPENGSKRQSTFELDLTKTPNEIVFKPLNGHASGRSKRGILSLENDQFKLCVNKERDQLPTTFSTKARDGLRLLVFKRSLR
jgi:uncharacterized protein (TIGR03067 family)